MAVRGLLERLGEHLETDETTAPGALSLSLTPAHLGWDSGLPSPEIFQLS